MLQLFQITGSCSFAARAALEEAGVEYEAMNVHPRRRDEPPELAAVNPACIITDSQFARLDQWVERHYRDSLALDDLRDPSLVLETRTALDELTQILKLGSVYPFQR